MPHVSAIACFLGVLQSPSGSDSKTRGTESCNKGNAMCRECVRMVDRCKWQNWTEPFGISLSSSEQRGRRLLGSREKHRQRVTDPTRQSECLDISTEETQEGRTQTYECGKTAKVFSDTTRTWQPHERGSKADPQCSCWACCSCRP